MNTRASSKSGERCHVKQKAAMR
jgi:hypothetical protein